jgi:hypothetical protein
MLLHNRNYVLVTLICLLTILYIPQAKADSLTVEVNNGAYLLNADSSQGRILLKFNLPSELSGAEIAFAELLVPLIAFIPDSSMLAVGCSPLLIAWNDEVTWADLGDTFSAEDVSDNSHRFSTSSEGDQEAYFNITDFVRGWQDSSLANNGFILYYDATTLPYFTYKRGESAPFATVRFDYTH